MSVLIPNNETLTQRQRRYRELTTNVVSLPQLKALIREGDDVQEIFRSTAYNLVATEPGRKLFMDMILNYDVNMEVSRSSDPTTTRTDPSINRILLHLSQ